MLTMGVSAEQAWALPITIDYMIYMNMFFVFCLYTLYWLTHSHESGGHPLSIFLKATLFSLKRFVLHPVLGLYSFFDFVAFSFRELRNDPKMIEQE